MRHLALLFVFVPRCLQKFAAAPVLLAPARADTLNLAANVSDTLSAVDTRKRRGAVLRRAVSLGVFMVAASTCGRAARAQATFGTATTYPAGGNPQSVTSADFNGDGKPDLAVANYSPSSVSILLGNASGGFGIPTSYPAGPAGPPPFSYGSAPRSVTSADFNGDGKPDIAVANENSKTVSVLLNNGSGGFGTPTNYPVVMAGPYVGPYSVTSADFNGDGKSDIAVVSLDFSSVSVLLNNGSGGFGTAMDYTTNASTGVGSRSLPYSVTSADFNGDGKLDIAVANLGTGNVSILLNDGSGGFGTELSGTAKTYPAGGYPRSVTSADFNGDGKPDIAVTNDSNTVSVLLGNGSGGFGAPTKYPVGMSPYSVTSADFNGDGKPDLTVANSGSNSVSILLGDGSGGFGTATNYPVGTNPQSVTSADFNGDGKPDIAVANLYSNDVSILLNTFTVTFTVTKTADTNDGSCSATDCSLREAIGAANINAFPATVVFAPSAFSTRKTITLMPQKPLPTISGNVSIQGPSSGVVIVAPVSGSVETVNAGATLSATRLLFSKGGTGIDNRGTLSLSQVTLSSTGTSLLNSGSATLSNCVLTKSVTAIQNTGTLSVQKGSFSSNGTGLVNTGSNAKAGVLNSTFSRNSTAIANSASLTLSSSTLSGNETALVNDGSSGAVSATVDKSTFTSNGSALLNQGQATLGVSGCTFSRNGTALNNLGGTASVQNSRLVNGDTAINNSGTLGVTGCTFSLNGTALNNPGGTASVQNSTLANGYTAINNSAALTLGNSTLSGNVQGVFNNGTSGAVTATVDQNTFAFNGSALLNQGQAVLSVRSCTIAHNYRGIASDGAQPVEVHSTILASNSQAFSAPTTATSGFNLVDVSVAKAGLQNDGSDNPILRNNGGPTATIALLANSVALNQADPAISAGKFDQRGKQRVVGGRADIGAFEFQGSTSPAAARAAASVRKSSAPSS